MKIVNLKCGYHTNPTQIARENVCFSWGTEHAGDQKGYRLQISHDDTFKAIYVDTQKVISSSNKFIKVKAKLSRATKYYWRVKVFSESGEEDWSEVQTFETKHKGFDAKWIACSKDRDPYKSTPSTRFRLDFNSAGTVKTARLYASAMGNYTAYLNNQKCGDQYLSPGWTEYKSRIQYQVFDVTEMIKEGPNCIGAVVSDGWYMGPVCGSLDESRCRFGGERAFFAQLEIDYEDDSYITVITNESWQSDIKSPYVRCEIYYGVDFDSREEDGFFKPGYLCRDKAKTIPYKGALIPEQGVPIRKLYEVKPVEIFETPKGETVIDFGQNMVGVPKIEVDGHLGQEIELQFFEKLDDDGCVYTYNLKTARQGLNYVLKNGTNEFVPEMTYYGFRYVHVIKWPGDVAKNNITGLVVSSNIEKTGYFKSSNELLNKFMDNTLWSQIGNYVDVPTDTPQRDGRMGWTGDAQLFIKTAAFNFDILTFFNKWLGDMTYSQRKNGSIPHVIPDVLKDENCAAGWGEACVIIPWQLYLRYGDIEILSKCYKMMQDFIDYRKSTAEKENIIRAGFQFGDWLALDSVEALNRNWGITPTDLISTAYFGYAAQLMEKIARTLEKKKDEKSYKELHTKIKEGFNKEFVTGTGRLASHTQTAYVLALNFNMLDGKAKERAISELSKLTEDYGCVTGGFAGFPYILDVLTETGRHDLALKLALKEDYPSWLYPVTMGATTLWEHWDSIMPNGKINPDYMNSFNSYAYGAIGNWFFEKIAGIVPDEKEPGYKHFFISPRPCNELSSLDVRLKTHYGTIKVSYEMNGDNVIMQVQVPDNTTAHLKLNDCKAYALDGYRKKYNSDILVKSGAHDITYVKGGSFLSSVEVSD